MNEENTIIILTHNNQDCIEKTINTLNEYMSKHPSTTQLIISDNASNDLTLPKIIHQINQLANPKILLITQPQPIPPKKCLLVALEQVQTNITVLLDPPLFVRLHQIKKQVELLRKCDFVIPSRLHKDSRTNYQPDLKKKLTRIFNKKRYEDLENPNKTFHTKVILPLIRKAKTENYWEEIIENNPRIRITQTSTHWVKQ